LGKAKKVFKIATHYGLTCINGDATNQFNIGFLGLNSLKIGCELSFKEGLSGTLYIRGDNNENNLTLLSNFFSINP
jgi:hypothetical protein